MTRLISKVQYKNFEAGEFIDIKERDYEGTIKKIQNFPWNEQRDKIVIDLTNPSITIEGKNNDFLKCALFYHNKYVLHYFDETQVLYTKSFINLPDTYEYIKSFFDLAIFNTNDFKRENTWLQHTSKHFHTQDFRYVVTVKSIRNYLISTSWMSFCVSIMLLIIYLYKSHGSFNLPGIIFLISAMFLMGGGLHLFLFFNYYNYVKDKVLIMSKGNDTFYFGNIKQPKMYNKKDIIKYTVVAKRGTKSMFYGFAIVKIELKNGMVLEIPNLLINNTSLENKLSEYPKNNEGKFPLI